MQRLLAVLFLPFCIPAFAQTSVSPLTALGGGRFNGPSDPAATTDASFGIGLTNNDGRSYTTTAGAGEAVTIYGLILPPAAHRGRTADVFIVDRINGKFMMKNIDGKFVDWNGRVPDLVPAIEDVMLSTSTQVEIFRGTLGVGGDHRLFLGYMVDGQLHYTPIPHFLSITGFTDLTFAPNNSTFVLPNIAGKNVDEARVYSILHGVKGAYTSVLSLKNSGNLPLTITAASLEGAPQGTSMSFDSGALEPGASRPVSFRFEASAASYAQLGVLEFARVPGKRFFVNMTDNTGKTYRYAIDYWFVHYGTYDVTRTISSTQRGCTLPTASAVVSVTGRPFAGLYHLKVRGHEIQFTNYAPDGSATFSQEISYDEEDGIVSEILTVRIDASGKLTGASTWRWTDFEDECRGTATYTGQIR